MRHTRRRHRPRFRGRKFDRCSSTPLYRSRKGMIMGVCRGIADHLNLRVFWVRMVALGGFLFTGFWPVGILYIIAGLILRPEPVVPLENEQDQEFYQSYTDSRDSAIQRLKRKFDNIDRRIQRMEDTVTRREFEL
ncbi:MAG: envelope stress response membrane protein PspC [Desulfobacterales bacterium]|nr:envelope stress response membrane protein PspC [Desulfobacterales bacterium]